MIIPTIQDQAGNYSQCPREINQTFYRFYHNLYSTPNKPTLEDIQTLLETLNLPQLSAEHKAILDTPLTSNDLESALYKMTTGRAPGPDGFPIEFLKHF